MLIRSTLILKSFCTSRNTKPSIRSLVNIKQLLTTRRNKMVKKQADATDVPAVKELDPKPAFIEYRQKLWEKFKAENDAKVASMPRKEITVKAKNKDGEVKELKATSWEPTSTPYELAKKIGSQNWVGSIVVAKVNGVLWDLERPLESDCNVEYVTFDDHEGQQVFWHSTAHMLGEACERIYAGHLCYGPPIADGFYYDMFMPPESAAHCNSCPPNDSDLEKELNNLNIEGDDVPKEETKAVVSTTHFPVVEKVMKSIANEKQNFERLELTKEQLLEMFNYNKFKVRILNEKVKTDRTTVYRCGTLIDLCLGPHVRNTGLVKAFKVTNTSSSLWEGKTDGEKLQRVYGISFPDNKQLKEWVTFQEEAMKRDHRKLGKDQGLFFFHELSPGSCFFTPRGAHIYNKLVDYIKSEYRKRGFTEVISPNIYNAKLWKTSGHWDHYAENMFSFEVEKETFALKPMNCPGHCLIFDSVLRSHKDLPLRLADFGVLHRNEISGALTGLTRVRRFCQDDAHIFCAPNQIKQEILGCLDFFRTVYSLFNFSYDMVLSTRPEKFMGAIETWNQAEAALAEAMDGAGIPWTRNEGDGAFYGPKIDITIKDALRRSFQCATIQLDFQLPLNFKLKFSALEPDESGEMKAIHKQPVIIHRAILGSVERFIAILTENFAGKWPFWLSPRQAIVLGMECPEYAEQVRKRLHEEGFQVDLEMGYKRELDRMVRNAQLHQYNFMLVVGMKEAETNCISIRTRTGKRHNMVPFDQVLSRFHHFNNTRALDVEDHFVESAATGGTEAATAPVPDASVVAGVTKEE